MLSQLMMLFGFFAFLLIMVYWVNNAVRLLDQLIADGQSIGVFATFSILTLPSLIRITLPIATFAASIYVTNRMMSDSELIVVQATGYSARRAARPVFYFGLIISLFMALLLHILVPVSSKELDRRQAQIAENATARLLRDGQFMTPTDGVTIYIREVTQSSELRDIFLSDSRGDGQTVTYTAASAYIVRTDEGPQLVMIDGLAQTLYTDDRRLVTTSFEDLAYNLGSLVSMTDASGQSMRHMTTLELLSPPPMIHEESAHVRALWKVEAHERFARSFQPLASSLIGFATLMIGGFSRFGVWRQITAAIFLIILVKIIESVVTSAISGNPALWALSYVPELFGATLAMVLLGWSSRPSWLRRKPIMVAS